MLATVTVLPCDADADDTPTPPLPTIMGTHVHVNPATKISAMRIPSEGGDRIVVTFRCPDGGGSVSLFVDDADLLRMCSVIAAARA